MVINSPLNDKHLRKYIFSFLRKEPKVSCDLCKICCKWDKKINMEYYVENRSKKTVCGICFDMVVKFYNHNIITSERNTIWNLKKN